jgi:hypothetical protein
MSVSLAQAGRIPRKKGQAKVTSLVEDNDFDLDLYDFEKDGGDKDDSPYFETKMPLTFPKNGKFKRIRHWGPLRPWAPDIPPVEGKIPTIQKYPVRVSRPERHIDQELVDSSKILDSFKFSPRED